jgi:hypothetical protein
MGPDCTLSPGPDSALIDSQVPRTQGRRKGAARAPQGLIPSLDNLILPDLARGQGTTQDQHDLIAMRAGTPRYHSPGMGYSLG